MLPCANICIMWIVSCCSGACVVDAVVTRLFASVRMWISASKPLMSCPKSSKHLTGAKTLHESIQLCNGSAEGSMLDFSRLKEHQGTTGISPTFDSLISNENGHSTLRGFVAVVPEGCIRDANDPRRTLNRPHTQFQPHRCVSVGKVY